MMSGTGNVIQALLLGIARIGAQPADKEERRVQKTVMVSTSLLICVASVLWGLTYVVLGEPLAGAIPLFYVAVSLPSIAYFGLSHGRGFQFFRFSQLLLFLVLPFLLMLELGGFVSSSAVILWSFFCPLGASLLCKRRVAWRWFLLYIGVVVAGGLLQPVVGAPNNLPQSVIVGFFVMNIAVISAIAFALLLYYIAQKDHALQLLRQEQALSERLLLNVLPEEIAAVLKVSDGTIAERFDAASVLFADVVGFTPLSESMAPEEMVHLLNEVFSYFDALADKHGLEKIRTVGDNYMVASGVPQPRPDHAQALARMALEMSHYIDAPGMPGGKSVQFRIGINSGPMIGGVIGRSKFHYDVWGDAVNVASRMESHGEPGKIQISEDTYQLIQNDFRCRPRGTIQVKGKGDMRTWYLEGIGDVEDEVLLCQDS